MANARRAPKPRNSRSPHGERGLKSALVCKASDFEESLPTRGAWIEINQLKRDDPYIFVAPHTGSVD